MAKKPEIQLQLDTYEGEGLRTIWCWKNTVTNQASQEFASKNAALEAWRKDELKFSSLEDLGD